LLRLETQYFFLLSLRLARAMVDVVMRGNESTKGLCS
jgi:hypothetical protein